MKILVLGMGGVGREIAYEMAKEHDVTAIDTGHHVFIDMPKRPDNMKFITMDLPYGLHDQMDYIKTHDMIINALPGDISYRMLKIFIPLGIDIVDISFMEEDPRELNTTAKMNGNIESSCLLSLTHNARNRVCDMIDEVWAELVDEE